VPGVGINVAITGDATGLKGALSEAEGGIGKMGGALNLLPMAAVATGALAVGAAVVSMTKAAEEDRAEQEKLLSTYDRMGISQDAANVATQAAIDMGAAKAISDSEVRAGLDSLITATGDADEANALLAVAMDVAAKAGVPLEQAADAVAKAHSGQDAALRKLFPGMEKQATAADTITEATKLSTGAADEYAKSAEGMAKKGSDAFGELGEEIGGAFLPIMDELMPLIGPIVDLLSELISVVLPLLGPAVDIVVIAIKALVTILKAVVDGIKAVMGWIGDMVDKVKGAADFIGSVDLNPFSLPGGEGGGTAPAPSGRSGRSTRSGGGAPQGNVTVNVYGGDPHAITRAVARGYRGWVGISGRTAGSREF
jgi:hypothetical protein